MPISELDYRIPILKLLQDGNIIKTKFIAEEVFKQFDFDSTDLGDTGFGHSYRYNRLNWAKTILRTEGLITQVKHGYWKITLDGLDYLKKIV